MWKSLSPSQRALSIPTPPYSDIFLQCFMDLSGGFPLSLPHLHTLKINGFKPSLQAKLVFSLLLINY